MRRTVLVFGIISAAVMASLMFINMRFAERIGFDKAEITGYTVMILAFLMVFFGIRSYRENIGGGYITFGRALAVGALIVLISSVIYVVCWEVAYFGFNFMPDFMDKYQAHYIEKLKATGISQEQINAEIKNMAEFKKLYDNPFFNFVITLVIEPLPVGLIIALISSAILRKRCHKSEEASPPMPAEFA